MAVDIHIDGSSQGDPGPGGWAAVIHDGGEKRALTGGEPHTTNDRMELLAAIKGLEATPAGAEVTVHSDSEYLVHTMTRNWKRNVNKDLWQVLDGLSGSRRVTWEWVQGHAGNPGNEEANDWANIEAGLQAEQLSAGIAPQKAAADPSPSGLTHLDERGQASMVDVGAKEVTQREAVARGFVAMQPETLRLIREGLVKKGDVVATARLAGIMGAKRTSDLIPLCHPIPLNQVTVELEADDSRSGVHVTATAKTNAKTGVEMEALTAVSVAALTLYDMCKSVDRGMQIQDIRLVRKLGGKSGDFVLEE